MEATIDKMYRMRQSGATLSSIGEAFGITKQAVCRQLIEQRGLTKIRHLLTGVELARLASCTHNDMQKLRYWGVIQPLEIPDRKHTLWAPDNVSKIMDYKSHPRLCRICSRPRPRNRPVYCSNICYLERWSYKNWSEEARQRQRERMKEIYRRKRISDIAVRGS